MVWLQFLASAAILVFAATRLATYGDVIAVRTRLSGMFIGTLLMAGATSLPELLSAINAIRQDVPNLAAGSMLGSSMFNMFVLAVLDLLYQQSRILRRVAMTHALTASLANLLAGIVVFAILAGVEIKLGWVGLDSLVIIVLYFGGVRMIQGGAPAPDPPEAEITGIPSLRKGIVGFGAASAVLILVTPFLVRSAAEISETTGLSTGFIGASLVAIVTSLPELVATMAAVRLGAFDLAIGNLFGSNIFNMFALGLTDVFFLEGRFLGAIDPAFAIAGILGLILTSLGLIGNLARVERRILFMELDALLILVGYFAGMYYLFSRGIGV